MRTSRSRTTTVLGLLTALVLTGCGGEAPADVAAASSQDPRAHVPAELARSSVLRMGTELGFEPLEFVRDGQPAGFDIDLGRALAEQLGLELEIVEKPWGDLRTATAAGELDIAMAGITDTAKRQEEVNFVDYLNVGTSLVARADLTGVEQLADMCGQRLAVREGTIFQELGEAQAGQCPAGKPLTLVVDGDGPAAVGAGRADGYLEDLPIAVSHVAKDSSLRVAGEQIEAAPYGIVVSKQQPELTKAVQLALYALFQDGTYDALLEQWKLPEGSLKTGAINGGA
jgi:polar amino acid transport system substrate-binding protein